ncbi:hypothetical protein BH18ACT17_BH18ACT17_13210 [soil metagenome]
MNTDIHALQLLQADLEAVATRERSRLASVDRALDGGGPGAPRRRPRHGHGGNRSWGGVAAALVVVLVLAGGIGVLSQVESHDDASSSGGSDRVRSSALAPESGSDVDGPQTTTAPGLEQADEAGEGGSGGLDSMSDSGNPTEFSTGAAGDGAGGSGSRTGVGAVPTRQSDLTKIIRDGRIGLVIADGSFSKGVSRVTQIARQNGGFVLESSSQDERSGSLTLRIPERRFDDAMLSLRGLAGELEGEVEFQAITGQDVTAEFIDLGARLEILQDRRDLLRDIQAEATSSGEILRLAALIDDVTLQVENIQGRLTFLRDQVDEATIKVEVRERDVQPEDPGPDTENPSLTDSFELAVQGFLRIVGAIVIGLGYLIPLGVIALLVWGVLTLVRRRDRGAS